MPAVRARFMGSALRLLVATVLCAGNFAAPAATNADSPVARTAVFLTGEYMVQAPTLMTGADASFLEVVYPTDPAMLEIYVRGNDPTKWMYLSFAAPRDSALELGTYTNAVRPWSRTGDQPGVYFHDNRGSSCGDRIIGTFTLSELERDADGKLSVLAVDFALSCSTTPTDPWMLTGELRINSTIGWAGWTKSPPTSMTFAPRLIGTTSPSQSVTVTATGPDPVTMQARLEGNGKADYTTVDQAGCLGLLTTGESCTFGVAFTPSSTNASTARLFISGNGFASGHGIALSGDGLNPTTTALTAPAHAFYPTGLEVHADVGGTGNWGSVFFEADGELYESDSVYDQVADTRIYLPPGDHSLIAHYMGDSVSAESFSTPTNVHVGIATGTYIDISPRSVNVGDTVRLYGYTIPAGSARLTGGTLSLVDVETGQTIASTPVLGSLGEVSVDFVPRTASPVYRFRAVYTGDGELGPSSNEWTLEVNKIRTGTIMTLPVPAHYPDLMTFSARVIPVPDGGNVIFETREADDSYTRIGEVPVNTTTGIASITAVLTPGTRWIFATFSGTAAYTSSGAGASHQVTVATSVSASADPPSGAEGATITVHGQVHGIRVGDPSAGQLVMTDADTHAFIASAPVTATSRTISADLQPAAGIHHILVSYVGAGDYDSSAYTVTISMSPPSTDHIGPAGNVVINGGQTYTNSATVNLALSATDPLPGSGVADMQFSSTGAADSWSEWTPYATSQSYLLTGADGAKQVYVRFRDGAGNMSVAASAGIVLDRQSPPAPPPSEGLVLNSVIGRTVPVLVSYATVDPVSGISRYAVGQSSNGGLTYSALSVAPTSSSTTCGLAPGSTVYRFRAKATDSAGNESGWATGPTVAVKRTQEKAASVRYTGSWAKARSSKASGASFRQTRSAGASVAFSFYGRDIGFVARRTASSGRADVYIDGVWVATLDLYSAQTSWRTVVFTASFAGDGNHTIEVRALGTKSPGAKDALVNVDAFVVVQ